MKNRWIRFLNRIEQGYEENQSIVDGAIIYTVILILIFVVLVGIFNIPEASVTGAGQFFADWLLFPTVIIGFWLAIKEFRQSQVVPKLQLHMTGDAGIGVDRDIFVLRTSTHNPHYYRILCHVENKGEVTTTWFRIEIDLPFDLISRDELVHEFTWHWGEDQANWELSFNPRTIRYVFKSNNQFALYPDEVKHIATIKLTIPPQKRPHSGEIEYSVVTDKTKIVRGEQPYRIIEENQQIQR